VLSRRRCRCPAGVPGTAGGALHRDLAAVGPSRPSSRWRRPWSCWSPPRPDAVPAHAAGLAVPSRPLPPRPLAGLRWPTAIASTWGALAGDGDGAPGASPRLRPGLAAAAVAIQLLRPCCTPAASRPAPCSRLRPLTAFEECRPRSPPDRGLVAPRGWGPADRVAAAWRASCLAVFGYAAAFAVLRAARPSRTPASTSRRWRTSCWRSASLLPEAAGDRLPGLALVGDGSRSNRPVLVATVSPPLAADLAGRPGRRRPTPCASAADPGGAVGARGWAVLAAAIGQAPLAGLSPARALVAPPTACAGRPPAGSGVLASRCAGWSWSGARPGLGRRWRSWPPSAPPSWPCWPCSWPGGRRFGLPELTWIVYPVLSGGGSAAARGSPARLPAATSQLTLYGGALLATPRLLARWRPSDEAEP
jgi:hypothetical protein